MSGGSRLGSGRGPTLSQLRRAAGVRAPREATSVTAEQADRVVVVDVLDGAWRVQAAHMEPLRFRSAAEAERAGHRVARTLARLGFNACVETYDALGDRTGAAHYPGETAATRSANRRLDS